MNTLYLDLDLVIHLIIFNQIRPLYHAEGLRDDSKKKIIPPFQEFKEADPNPSHDDQSIHFKTFIEIVSRMEKLPSTLILYNRFISGNGADSWMNQL